MLETISAECPYCGEEFTTVVDCSAGDLDYIEDCPVCCRPIEFSARIGDNGIPVIRTRRDDE
jgi:hypothetical protein